MSTCANCGCSSDDCACDAACEKLVPLGAPFNPPGRPTLNVRIGDYGRFFSDATSRLSSVESPALRSLGTRDLSDPTIAILDAWSIAADVLTFYRERLTNEGYRRTATDERSLRWLASEVGYKPRPGVAASVHLAYLLDPSAKPVDIPAGAKAQSVPAAGQQMQTYETLETLSARAEWSEMKPRLTQIPPIDLVGALTRTSIKLSDTSLVIRPGERMLFVFGPGLGQQVVREVAEAKTDVQNGWVDLTLKSRPGIGHVAEPLVNLLRAALEKLPPEPPHG